MAHGDDLLLVAADLEIELLKRKVEVAIHKIGRWMIVGEVDFRKLLAS